VPAGSPSSWGAIAWKEKPGSIPGASARSTRRLASPICSRTRSWSCSGIGRRTPASVYAAREKARPTGAIVDVGERRLRFDKVDKIGSVTLRYRGRLHHIGIGAAYKGWRVAMLIDGRNIEIVGLDGSPIR
jgi:hypothetical protein